MGTYTIIGVDILYVALDPRITYATATETKWLKYLKKDYKRKMNYKKLIKESHELSVKGGE
jgi:hypothetical protein